MTALPRHRLVQGEAMSHREVQNACEFVEDSAHDCLAIVKELRGPYTRSQVRDWQTRLNNAASALSDASLELSLLER